MARDRGFYEYVMHDLLENIEGITAKGMFGGWGFYKDGVIFGIIAEGSLYFKVGESNIADYKKHKSEPFVYEGRAGKKISLGYWRVPESVLEDTRELERWINKSVEVGAAGKKKK